MGRLSSLKKKDIEIANSLGRVLALFDLTEDDLLLLKDIQALKEYCSNLESRLEVIENELTNMQNIRLTKEAKEYLLATEGETLNV